MNRPLWTERLRLGAAVGAALLMLAAYWLRYQPQWGDFGMYADQGRALLERRDPFANPLYGAGSSAAIFGLLVQEAIPSPLLLNLALLVANVGGVVALLRVFMEVRDRRRLVLVAALVPLTMPYRVGFADVQVAGMLLLFLAASMALARAGGAWWRWAIAGLLGMLAFDFKPAMVVGFLAVIFAVVGSRYLFAVGSAWLISHGLINLWTGELVEVRWVARLGERATEALVPGPELSPWQLLYGWGLPPSVGRALEALLIIALLFAIYRGALRYGPAPVTAVAALIPLVTGYQHLYDSLAIAGVAVCLAGLHDERRWFWMLGFLILPATEVQERSILIVLALALIHAITLGRGSSVGAGMKLAPILVFPTLALGVVQRLGLDPVETIPWYLLAAFVCGIWATRGRLFTMQSQPAAVLED